MDIEKIGYYKDIESNSMTKREKIVTYFAAFIFMGCNGHQVEKEYFSSGELKSIVELKDGLQDGKSKLFYENGQIAYIGTYALGHRIGEHISYYQNGKVKYEYTYVVERGKEKAISKKKFNRNGLPAFHSKFSIKQYQIQSNKTEVYVGDTLELNLKILNSRYENCSVILGPYDEFLNILDAPQPPIKTFDGNLKHEINFWVLVDEVGENKITGMIKDFTVEPINDTLGYTLSEDAYFEYRFESKQRKLL